MTRENKARIPIVGVMGSGSFADEPRCMELGRWLAAQGVHLLTGGGAGAMSAVSRGFGEVDGRRGSVIGVLPARARGVAEPPDRYPNPWVEIAIRTHLHLSGTRGTELESRNHINVLSSDVVIALPGSSGTRSEVELAVQYGRPVVAYLSQLDDIPQLPETVPVVSNLEEVAAFVRAALCRTA